MRNLSPLALTLTLGLLAASCSSSTPSGGSGSGGSTSGSGGHATGGNSSGGSTGSSGGSTGSSGGTTGTGGSTGSSGGSIGSGGVQATGGSTGSGGAQATGGAAGNRASGGTTGSGGAQATGGAGGNRASGGAGGATTGSGGTTSSGGSSGAGVFFSDDFESDTSGMQPAGWDNIIAYNYKTTNPMGSLSALADSTHTHNSSKLAAHFKSDGNMVFLERQLPTGTTHLFVRAYFYMTRQLGMGPSDANHESLLGITKNPNNADTEVRFGEIKGVVGTNAVPSDDIAPVMAKWYGPPVISANAWHCIEVEFDGTASYNTLNAWSDGTLVHSITQASDWAHAPPGEPANWMSGLFNYVFFGWQSFSSAKNEVWMDDLVMSTAKIGCN